mmetsp:Transcript_21773/g.37060  ORF Transcript_21773/g.37060 Transcript_21773/m.37060 type:complete len:90 (+) Transcript_21773:319-588(+)
MKGAPGLLMIFGSQDTLSLSLPCFDESFPILIYRGYLSSEAANKMNEMNVKNLVFCVVIGGGVYIIRYQNRASNWKPRREIDSKATTDR